MGVAQSPTAKSVDARLAEELAVDEVHVAAAVRLLDEGGRGGMRLDTEPIQTTPHSKTMEVFLERL
jgi:hypothetical protein